VLALSGPVDWLPLTALLPLHPPVAEQEVALLADQVSVALPPAVTALGPTLKLTLGAVCETVTVADCAALPLGPVQLRV
jgi:hypothetical protein